MFQKLFSSKKLMCFLFIDLLLIAALIGYFGFYKNKIGIQIHGTYMPHALAFADFELTDTHNQLFTAQQLLGHWTIVYFGFSSCPSICPTTLAHLNKFYQHLPAGMRPQVLFISVDPQRDTLDTMKNYLHQINPAFIGARAPIEQVIHLEQSLHLNVSAKNPLNHSMDLVLINPQGAIQAYFAYPQSSQYLTQDYLSIVQHYQQG